MSAVKKTRHADPAITPVLAACSIVLIVLMYQAWTRPLSVSTARDEGRAAGTSLHEAGLAHRIDLNTATAAELSMLPGFGRATVRHILDDRAENGPFLSLEDVDRVYRIGPRTLERIAPFVTVEPMGTVELAGDPVVSD